MAVSARDSELAIARTELERQARELAARTRELGERDARVEELDAVARHLSRLVVLRERELSELRGQIDEVCARARGYATRVRMQALRQAAEIAGPNGKAGGVNGAGAARRAAVPSTDASLGATDEDRAAAETLAEAPESTFGVRPTAPLDLFEGIVQLEIGPLSDFSQLVGFEDAAGAIGAAREISVKRFSRGRASIDVRLDEPVDLLRELEERAPFDFKVRSLRDGRLILDLDEEAEAA